MLSKRKTLPLVGALLSGIVVYYGLVWFIAFLVDHVFHISISSADARSLFIMVIWKLVPLACAMLTAVFITYRSWRRHDHD
jgi:hypothetical protein